MALFRRVIYVLAASTMALAASSLNDVTIYASSTKLQLGEQVTLGAKTTAPIFMALVVSTLKPNLDPEFAINTTTSGVNADVVHITDDDLLARTGPSQAFSKACIDGRGMDVSSPYLPDIAGNWTLAYIVQYFSPSEGGRYTYEGDKVCLSPPMNVESMLAGYLYLEVTPGDNGATSIPSGSQAPDAPIATSVSTAMAASLSPAPTGEPFNLSSSSTRRFEAIFNGRWALVVLSLGFGSGFFMLL